MGKSSLRIAITGANGFVGKNLRTVLNNYKIPSVCLARKNFKSYSLETKVILSDYSENKILPQLKKCDALVHLIGIGKQTVNSDYLSVNVELTRKIVELCKKTKIKKIVFNSGLGTSENSLVGYFISKYKAEQEIIESGLDYTIFRPSYIVGKDDLLTKNLNSQIKKGKIVIPGSGNYNLQPIFVNDAAEIILQSISSKKYSNKILDLVGPEIITFEKFVKIFINKKKVRMQKINLESAFYDAIHNPKSYYGVDDLNILLGNFIGDFKKLKKISNFSFTNFRNVLKSSSLS
jgi:NADH dehydrogenase